MWEYLDHWLCDLFVLLMLELFQVFGCNRIYKRKQGISVRKKLSFCVNRSMKPMYLHVLKIQGYLDRRSSIVVLPFFFRSKYRFGSSVIECIVSILTPKKDDFDGGRKK